MGWDYHTYMSQPSEFLEAVTVVKNMEAEYSNAKEKQRELKNKHG